MIGSTRSRAELALAGITILWGATFTLVKDALNDASTLAFLAVRFAIATAILVAVFGRKLTGWRRHWKLVVAAGVFLALGYFFQTAGLRLTTASKSAFLTSLCVPLVPLLGLLVYRNGRSTTGLEALGIAACFSGMILLTWPDTAAGWNLGDILTAFAALAFAAHIQTLGKYGASRPAEILCVGQIAVVAMLTAAALGTEPLRFHLGPRLVFALLVTSLLCTALAYSVQVWAQRHTGPTRAALIFSMEPVAAAATAWAVSGETLTPRGWAGAALILGGVLFVEMKPALAARHPSQ